MGRIWLISALITILLLIGCKDGQKQVSQDQCNLLEKDFGKVFDIPNSEIVTFIGKPVKIDINPGKYGTIKRITFESNFGKQYTIDLPIDYSMTFMSSDTALKAVPEFLKKNYNCECNQITELASGLEPKPYLCKCNLFTVQIFSQLSQMSRSFTIPDIEIDKEYEITVKNPGSGYVGNLGEYKFDVINIYSTDKSKLISLVDIKESKCY